MKKSLFTSILVFGFFISSFSQIYNSIRSIDIVPDETSGNSSLNIIINGYRSSGSVIIDSVSTGFFDDTIEITLNFHSGAGPQVPGLWKREISVSDIEPGDYYFVLYEKNQLNKREELYIQWITRNYFL